MSRLSLQDEFSDVRHKACKRKRNSSEDEDLENMPPSKQTATSSKHIDGNDIDLQSSSPLQATSDEEVGYFTSIENQDYVEMIKNSSNDCTYSENSLSSFSLNDGQGSILSPLENIGLPRGDSTPHSSKRAATLKSKFEQSRQMCPFPALSWADPCEVWKRMCTSDIESVAERNPHMIERHDGLQLRMRAILIDWLNEVSEVYRLQRETFHLSIDYVDRYLSNTEDIPKARLQLIGITCLFIASKVEEVYPPKVAEFAYVTDNACQVKDILNEEVVILQALGWSSTTITMNAWLKIYMQLSSESKHANIRLHDNFEEANNFNSLRPYTFVFPQYSSLEFTVIAQLIDLAALHVGVNAFPYSMVAASAVSHAIGIEMALKVSGYSWEELAPCHFWLMNSVEVLEEEGMIGFNKPLPNYDSGGDFMSSSSGLSIICPNVNLDESHRIQMHNTSLAMFDKVEKRMAESQLSCQSTTVVEASPAASTSVKGVVSITPPQSRHKGTIAKEFSRAATESTTKHQHDLPERPNVTEAI